MAYLIGTDEAGYGPNLGPLVVTASVWQVESLSQTDLFACLRKCIRKPREEARHQEIQIGDSKELYKPGQGLAGLEQGVLTFLAALQMQPRSWKTIWEMVAQQDAAYLAELPWYHAFDAQLPVDFSANQVSQCGDRLRAECQSAGCVPTRIASRVICPPTFNALCEQHGNKASALSQTTLGLIHHVLEEIPDDEPVYVLCDKHGGRNKYGPLLNEVFPDTLAIVRTESRTESAYQLGQGNQRREIVFRAKADALFLPSALASMVSKYLRELAMRAFNQFWASHVEGLKPTAGYPVDAKRFKQEIAKAQEKLGIDDWDLWRNR